MFEIAVKTQFNSAHRLRGYNGKCEELHGHNWIVESCVACEEVGEDGMVMDFTILKRHVNNIMDQLDHKFLNDLEPFNEINPSSENIAQYIYQQLKSLLADSPVIMRSVKVYETDTSCATYYE